MGSYYAGVMNSSYDSELKHHGILGQKWGVKNGPPYPLGSVNEARGISVADYKFIAKKISDEVAKYGNGGPAGNQNCQLCTWAMECQCRGMDVLPRPIYSPRDPALALDGVDIVKFWRKESMTDLNDVVSKVLNAGDGARFYTHVKWKDGNGGHEFITANINGQPVVIDAQVGTVANIHSKDGKYYFDDIDFPKSFMARMDNKDLNSEILKQNDKSQIVEWDWNKDVPFMKEHGMLSDADLEYAKKYMRT